MGAAGDFIRAALPWIAMGLFLAVFFVKMSKKKTEEENKEDYGLIGMCIGLCLGNVIGSSMEGGSGTYMLLGMTMGLALGSQFKKDGKA